ncbi:MAG TPA: CoA transferase [Sporichthyaceae bacterium]|nr:CoA transferase [Sporichthyaceae bacterium]
MPSEPLALTDRLRTAVADPLTRADAIDLPTELDAVLADVGLKAADAGGTIDFIGADPVVPGVVACGSAAALSLVAKSVAIAALWQARGNPGQDIAMDVRVAPHRLCPFYERKWELLNGLVPATDWDVTALHYTNFWRTRDGRWVLPQGHYPRQRIETLKLLQTYDDPEAIAAAIAGWTAADLEEAGAAAGIVMPMVRSTAEFLETAQYREVLATLPLIELEKIGDSDPEPFGAGDAPLAGIRALGLSHVIAGGGIGRTLALHGADALNVWAPFGYEAPTAFHTAQYGVRTTRMHYDGRRGGEAFRELARTGDVFYTNRRPRLQERLGVTARQLAELRPGIVHASVTLHGETGPWAGRAGFDQTAGSIVGMMLLEGSPEAPKLPFVTVVNDWIVPWLVSAGIAAALIRRATEGGSYRVHVSLTRVAAWILSLGIFDKAYAAEVAGHGEHIYPDPELFTSDGPLGRYQGVTEQVRMSATPGEYRFGLLPMGAARPEWLPR